MNANMEYVNKIESRDMVGAAYKEIVAAATEGYWVVPISTDNVRFGRQWRVTDVGQNGKVHYTERAR